MTKQKDALSHRACPAINCVSLMETGSRAAKPTTGSSTIVQRKRVKFVVMGMILTDFNVAPNHK
jgi:hypothetical protein